MEKIDILKIVVEDRYGVLLSSKRKTEPVVNAKRVFIFIAMRLPYDDSEIADRCAIDRSTVVYHKKKMQVFYSQYDDVRADVDKCVHDFYNIMDGNGNSLMLEKITEARIISLENEANKLTEKLNQTLILWNKLKEES